MSRIIVRSETFQTTLVLHLFSALAQGTFDRRSSQETLGLPRPLDRSSLKVVNGSSDDVIICRRKVMSSVYIGNSPSFRDSFHCVRVALSIFDHTMCITMVL